MKKMWWITGCCCLWGMLPASAQTFSLKPVHLLPAVKPAVVMPAPAPVKPAAYPVYMMASNAYYNQHFGFFCKQEWGWQKKTGLPLKVRLGSYDYTQRKEGK
ncbi:hypothetical protein [Chitinophaga solisilvae]|uniref:Uncharacterized protein n=1 Tax=Chitinophaga solisilvae TaxID=1233460 RepID=A0A9Q5DDS4_9BACT|nr:hypothetical protein [Chitinophaga solisilvae]NSL89415.1 hypothetical protein [Chitinophaga solisilvae]